MSAIFNGSTSKIVLASSVVGATPNYPVAIFSWIKQNNIAASRCYGCVANNGDGALYEFNNSGAPGVYRAYQAGGGSFSGAASGGTLSNGVWAPCTSIFVGATDRRARAAGSAYGTETTSITTTGLASTIIGCLNAGSDIQFYDGRRCEVAIWAGFTLASFLALVTELEAGRKPSTVLPGSLVFYQPLRAGVNESGSVGGTVTASNVTYDGADHPTIYVPASPLPAGINSDLSFSLSI